MKLLLLVHEYYLEQIFEKSQFRTIPHLKCPGGAVL